MNKVFATTFISALLISALAGILFNNFAEAQFPPFVNYMYITIQSPQNETLTRSTVILDFTVNNMTGPASSFGFTWYLTLSGFSYELDGHGPGHLYVTCSVSGDNYYCHATLYNLTEGYHDLKIIATAERGSYGTGTYQTWTRSARTMFTMNVAAPHISVLSFNQHTYNTSSLPLDFSVSESDISWMGFSLDGAANQTINGNTTLTGLSERTHTIVVYATDTAGTTGASPSISFNIETQQTEPSQPQGETGSQPSEPFPTIWIVASLGSVAVAIAVLIVYFIRVKKITREVQ
jgi:hypothetical protein